MACSGQKLECELSRFEEIEKTLKIHNEQGQGVYFVVNYGGHDDNSITRINAQFAEMDNVPLEEQLARTQAFSAGTIADRQNAEVASLLLAHEKCQN